MSHAYAATASSSSPEEEADPPAIKAREVFHRFRELARMDRTLMVLACVLATISAATEAAVVLVFMVITDDVLETRNLNAFWSPALLWVGFTALGAAAMFGRDLLTSLASERFLLRLRTRYSPMCRRCPPTSSPRGTPATWSCASPATSTRWRSS